MTPPPALSTDLSAVEERVRLETPNPVPIWKSAFLVLLGCLVWGYFFIKPPPTVPSRAGVVMSLPGYVRSGSGYIGTPAAVSQAELTILPKDTEFARNNYSDYPDPDHVFCGIVLSGAMQQSIHRPEVCLVGQGWTIINQETIPVVLPSGHLLRVKNLTIKKNVVTDAGRSFTITEYNMYWFVGENVTTPYHWMRIFLSSWDRIVHDRAHRWAYVTVSSPITEGLIPNGKNAAQTKAMMIDFIKAVVPTFQKDEMPPSAASVSDRSSRAPS